MKINNQIFHSIQKAQPKTIEIISSFRECAPACKKSVHSICSVLRYSHFYSPVTRLATPMFDHAHPQCFLPTLNLCEFVSGYYIDFFLEIWLIKKSYNLIGCEHFCPYLRKNFFPKYGICAGTQQIIYIFNIEQIQ